MKFAVLPAWIKCPGCGLAVLSDASSVRGTSCEIYCDNFRCVQRGKRFKIDFQTIDATPVYESDPAS